jgi:glutamate carboxypeptidase
MKCRPELEKFLRDQMPTTIDLLKQMVAINSFTANREGVETLGKLTAEVFSEMGFVADYVPSVRPDFGRHLVLTRKGTSSATIGLISHLDTVYPAEEEARNNFSWRVDGEKIYGPGTVDIKGGTMMIHLVLSAIRALAPSEFEKVTWVVLLNSSEEVLSWDFGNLCLERLKGNVLGALVFEAGVRTGETYSLVTARKGRAVFRVNVEGRGAHAGSHHHRGANAIVQLADAIQRLSAITDYEKALTVNVATLSGGTVINRVPHEASAEGEMRTFDAGVYQEAIKKILALNGLSTVRSAENSHAAQVKTAIIQESPPWPRNDGTTRLFDLWQQSGRDLGLTIVREERGGISDGNFICHKVPTIDGLGPNGDNAHCSEQSADGSKEQEYVDEGSFVPKAALNVTAILRLIAEV